MKNQQSMSPYQIRLNLLQLAFDILTKKHESEAVAKFNYSADTGLPLCVTSPTTEEVIAEAEKMNKFISTSI